MCAFAVLPSSTEMLHSADRQSRQDGGEQLRKNKLSTVILDCSLTQFFFLIVPFRLVCPINLCCAVPRYCFKEQYLQANCATFSVFAVSRLL